MSTNRLSFHPLCIGRLAAISLWLGLAAAGASASPPLSPPPAADDADALERKFWVCDHASTREFLDFGAAAQCSMATERLRHTRFGGDFAAMLTWWRAHKAAQHAALDAGRPIRAVAAVER